MPRKAQSASAASSGAEAKRKTPRTPKTAQKAAGKPNKAPKAKGKAKTAAKAKRTPAHVLASSEGIEAKAVSEPPGRGRPTAYTAELADEVVERMHNGETLNEICRSEHMPSARTVRRWNIDNVEGFSPRYAQARRGLLDYFADDIVEISDTGTNDYMERNHGDDAGWIANGEHVQRSRLRVESRKWLLSKLRPDEYGERTRVDHGITSDLAQLLGAIDGNGASLF